MMQASLRLHSFSATNNSFADVAGDVEHCREASLVAKRGRAPKGRSLNDLVVLP